MDRLDGPDALERATVTLDASLAPAGGHGLAGARRATRLATDFLLRWAAMLLAKHDGDLLEGLVWTCLFSANTRSQETSGRIAPMPVTQIAASLQQPFETVRRRCLALEQKGLVRRTRHGYILLALEHPSAEFDAEEAERCVQIRRFLRALDAAGVALPLQGPPGSATLLSNRCHRSFRPGCEPSAGGG